MCIFYIIGPLPPGEAPPRPVAQVLAPPVVAAPSLLVGPKAPQQVGEEDARQVGAMTARQAMAQMTHCLMTMKTELRA